MEGNRTLSDIGTGKNLFTIKITAANGNIGTYLLNVERAGPPTWSFLDEQMEISYITPNRVIATDTKIMISWASAIDNNSPILEYEVYMYPNHTVTSQAGCENTASSCIVEDGKMFCRQRALILQSAPATNLELVSCLSAATEAFPDGYFFGFAQEIQRGGPIYQEATQMVFL